MAAETMISSREEARFWDQLLQFIDERRVIPLVGRDLLEIQIEGKRVPLYRLLAERLASYLEVDGDRLPDGGELNEVACRYLGGPGRRDAEDIYSGLKALAAWIDEVPLPDPLVKLAEIRPLQLFVSTTFDPLLGRALDRVRFAGRPKTNILAYSPSSATDLSGELAALTGPTVFHLLGRLSAIPDFAVTDEDTLEFVHSLQSKGQRPSLLFDELGRQQLIMIGCSYPDWLARFFIRTAAGDRLSMAGGKSFVADAKVRDDPDFVQFLDHFGTRIRLYRSGGAVEFVDELHQRWTAHHPTGPAPVETPAQPAASPQGMEPGSVFLSYAREDLDAARAIREELERAGLDVWFDLKSLEPGDAFEREIRYNIEHCSIFVPLISRHTLTPQRRFFRLEWSAAERVAKMAAATETFIIPVAIDDASPDDLSLPETFRRLHWERLPTGRTTPKFVDHLKALFREFHKARQTGVS